MASSTLRLLSLIPLLLVASADAKTWRYWPNIGCFDFNFERTIFFELTNEETMVAYQGSQLPALVNSSIVPSIDHELFYQHTMTGSIRNSTTNTPEECITFCNATGYAYAGLQEGIRCLCFSEEPRTETDPEKCNMNCAGDDSFSCGGEWTMDLHQNPAFHETDLTYIGCFKNSYNDFDRLLVEGEFNNFQNNTPEVCVGFCTAKGYEYAGTQYGSQCICSNAGPQGTSEEGMCNYKCSGDSSIRMCGGLGYINMFHTDDHSSEWSPRPGCGNSETDLYYQKWYADMAHCNAEIEEEVDDIITYLNITSEYRVSLTWMSTADLDIYVKILATGEVIKYTNKESQDGKVDLDVDRLAGTYPSGMESRWVENVSFRKDGTYEVYVNNHNAKSDSGEIPYSLIIKLDRKEQVIHGSWNIDQRGDVRDHDLSKMIKETTIKVEGSEETVPM